MHLIWAAFGMMLLARELGMSKMGQTVSCIVFACSQFLISRQGFISMIWTAAWFPWLIYLIEKRRQNASRSISRGLVLCVGFMLLAGHAQWSAYQLFFGVTWWIWRSIIDKNPRAIAIKKSLYLGRDLALGIGLACVQLIPTAELLVNSQRASSVDYELAMTYSFWPWRLLTLFLPNIFGNPGYGNYWGYGAYWEDAFYFGVLPAILLLLSLRIFLGRWEIDYERKQLASFLWGCAIISIILAMGKNTPIFPFLYRHFPGFDMFQAPARLMVLAVFSFALLAGMGVRYWKKPEGKSLYWTRLGTAGSAAIIATSLIVRRINIIQKESIPTAFFTLGLFLFLYGVLGLTIGMKGVAKKVWIMVVLVSLSLDLYMANNRLISWIDANIFNGNNNSIADNDDGNFFVYFPEQDLYNIKFNKFLQFSDFSNKDTFLELRSNFIPDINMIDHVPVLNNFDPLLPAQYVTLMNYLDELPGEAQVEWLRDLGIPIRGITDKQNEAVFEPINTNLQPVLWTNCTIYSKDISDAFKKVNSQILAQKASIHKENRCAIIAEKNDLSATIDSVTTGIVTINSITPQRMIIDTKADTEGWVTFRRSWYPGWKIRIDEGDTKNPVLTDGNFMGISVPAGKHRLELFYFPGSFYIGLMISIISVVLVGFLDSKKNQ
jgi:hypothetical protein